MSAAADWLVSHGLFHICHERMDNLIEIVIYCGKSRSTDTFANAHYGTLQIMYDHVTGVTDHVISYNQLQPHPWANCTTSPCRMQISKINKITESSKTSVRGKVTSK